MSKYRAQYVETSRLFKCRACSKYVSNGSLTIAVMLQSRHDDVLEPVHYHVKCFFNKQRVTSDADIDGFVSLRIADQNYIQEFITAQNTVVVLPTGSKRGATSIVDKIQMSEKALRDFGVEYSKSARANCCGCRQKIAKSIVRVKKVVYDTEIGMKFGGQALWHHVDCFAQLTTELGWYGSGDQLPGFQELQHVDKAAVLKAISPTAAEDIPELKKRKIDETSKDLEELLTQQNEEYFAYRDFVDSKLQRSNWIRILEANHQNVQSSDKEILDLVADILTFGALEPCSQCGGQFVVGKNGYVCTGRISEWARCENKELEPKRKPCQIPSRLTERFKGKKMIVQARVFRPSVTADTKEQDDIWALKAEHTKPPLYLMEVVCLGSLIRQRDVMKPIIEKMGGKLVTKIHPKTIVVLATVSEVEKMSSRMLQAKENDIQVCEERFLNDIKNGSNGDTLEYIKNNSICDWGSDPFTRIDQNESVFLQMKSIYTRAVPTSIKLKLVDGTVVDPDSGLVTSTNVLIEGATKYFAILNLTDIQENKNSYYKLQLLESYNKSRYYVFSAWGRIGTTIGGNRTMPCASRSEAIQLFNDLYIEKTGNEFNAKTFTKKPGKLYPIDVDYSNDNALMGTDSSIPSNQPAQVQSLVKLIFDVNEMKKTMVEFDLDLTKMPLGKISKLQLKKAMEVLTKLCEIIKMGGSRAMFISESNQFFTLIPHNFGVRLPPIINTIEMVTTKREMLESLLAMEFAYSILQSGDDNDNVNPIDKRFSLLQNDIRPMDRSNPMFDVLAAYLQNTHAHTHTKYTIEIEEIFEISRHGEERRYESYKQLHNRKLLWHGSRLTNFVGILSHGLKIAPPEVPVQGYMFGKGVYFADMSSKSANYCFTSRDSNTGLLMLCEVALGDMLELKNAEMITQLPKGKHSVKGLGQTYPNPIEAVTLNDGVEIPMGKPVCDLDIDSSLLYNEYIVYDVAQVKEKFLFKCKFNYN